MYQNRINLHKQISDSQKILREKYKKFKKDEDFVEQNVSKVLKPVIQPLNQLVENSTAKKQNELKKKRFHYSTPEPDGSIVSSDIEEDENIWRFATAYAGSHNHTNASNNNVNNNIDRNNTYDIENEQFDVSQAEDLQQEDSGSVLKPLQKNESESNDDNQKKDTLILELFKVNKDSPKIDKSVVKNLNKVRRKDNTIDLVTGVRKLSKGFRFGDSSFTYNNNFYKIKGEQYKITPGLTELLFKKSPISEMITENDVNTYQNLIMKTNAYRNNYKSDNPVRVDKSTKFATYLSKLVRGSGFKIAKKNDKTEYVYWDDPNELVERLKLLDAEKAAGNNNLDNEIQNILEELSERGYI